MSLSGHLSGSLSGRLSGSLSGSAGSAPVNPYVPPIGVTPLVLWDARGGVAAAGGLVDSWTDQIRGVVLTPPGAAGKPAFSADGTNFFGRPVVRFDGVDDQLRVINAPPPPLWTAGSRPHWFYVYRAQGGAIASQRSLWIGLDEPPTSAAPFVFCPASADTINHAFFPGQQLVDPTPIGQIPHLQEFWITGAGTFASRDGATPVTTADASPVSVDVKSLYVGSDHTGNFVTMTLAALGCYPAALTAPQRAALAAYYQAQWDAPSRLPPLPASAVEYWHAGLGCTPSAWVGQMTGLSIPGVGSPVVAVDPGFFNGRPVAQTRRVPKQNYYLNPGANFAMTGARPYLFSVFRLPTALSATAQNIFSYSSGGTERFGYYVTTMLRTRQSVSGGNTLSTWAPNANVHTFEEWSDADFGYVRVDGLQDSVAWTNSGNVAWVGLGIGSTGSNAMEADANHAFHLLCSSKPTDPEIAALKAWAATYWGSPP